MKLIKSYVIPGQSEFEVTVTNDGYRKTLSICTYWKGDKVPLFSEITEDLLESLVDGNELFKTISQIILDIPKAEKTLDFMLDDWKFKEFDHE